MPNNWEKANSTLAPTQGAGHNIEALTNNRRRFDNLIKLAEEGSFQIDVVRNRLNELEEERAKLERFLSRSESTPAPLDIDEIKKEVAKFVLNFEERIEVAPIKEKKELVQRCISRIVVDKERMVVRFYVNRIPAVSPHLEAFFVGRPAGSVMSEQCARPGMDDVANSGWWMVREMSL